MAYANTISLVTKFMPLLDEIYKAASKTAVLDTAQSLIRTGDTLNASEIKVAKIAMQGLGTYVRASGFADGDVTLEWESLTLTAERGRGFQIDDMDNQESLEQAFGRLVSEFIRTKVVPEVDAYRFSKYASWSGVSGTSGEYTASTAIKAIDAAVQEMNDDEVPEDGRIMFMSNNIYSLIKQSTNFQRRITPGENLNRNFEYFDEMRIIRVPKGRFYSAVTLYDGTTAGQLAGGYVKGSTASNLNFAIIHPTSVAQFTKHVKLRVFAPDVNQAADAYKFQYRLYHDAFVYDNKVAGVYIDKRTNQTVTFTVKDNAGTAVAIEAATVTIDGRDYTTNSSGVAAVGVPTGTYAYSVVSTGHDTTTGTVTVAAAAVAEAVTCNITT